jgi:hypothetical protein
MLLNNLQFQLSDDERDVELIPIHQLLCIRLTEGSLEFLREKPNGSTSVIALEGINLCVLRPAVIHNQLFKFKCGLYEPQKAQAFVVRISRRLGWTKATTPMSASPNTSPLPLCEFETGTTRDLWQLRDLEAFGVYKGIETKFLLQFPRHSYVLDCPKSTFSHTLAMLKDSNMQVGMLNKFSVFVDAKYPTPPHRFQMNAIACKERELADQSTWTLIIDNRTKSMNQTIAMD